MFDTISIDTLFLVDKQGYGVAPTSTVWGDPVFHVTAHCRPRFHAGRRLHGQQSRLGSDDDPAPRARSSLPPRTEASSARRPHRRMTVLEHVGFDQHFNRKAKQFLESAYLSRTRIAPTLTQVVNLCWADADCRGNLGSSEVVEWNELRQILPSIWENHNRTDPRRAGWDVLPARRSRMWLQDVLSVVLRCRCDCCTGLNLDALDTSSTVRQPLGDWRQNQFIPRRAR